MQRLYSNTTNEQKNIRFKKTAQKQWIKVRYNPTFLYDWIIHRTCEIVEANWVIFHFSQIQNQRHIYIFSFINKSETVLLSIYPLTPLLTSSCNNLQMKYSPTMQFLGLWSWVTIVMHRQPLVIISILKP